MSGVVIHGQGRKGRQTRAFRAYHEAKRRCIDKKRPNWKNYGGRGIEFRFTSFLQFFSELGPNPPGKSLDRIDNDGHYEPGNVRWATRHEQNLNQRYRPDRQRRMLGNKLFLGRKHSSATKKKMAEARRKWHDHRNRK